MTARPSIFISAVSCELQSARQLVANTLIFLGYQPVWQDTFGTESGDLHGLLQQKINQCKGVVQLVGYCYGAEPAPTSDQEFGRVSYTQYEALYARKTGKKVWYFFIEKSFPVDSLNTEPDERRQLQAAYRLRLQSDTHVYRPLTTTEGLEASVLKLRDDLLRLRRGVRQWATSVAILLILITVSIFWLLHGQHKTNQSVGQTNQALAEMSADMAKMRQTLLDFPRIDAETRQQTHEENAADLEERVYAELGKLHHLDPTVLKEKLPKFAEEVKRTPNATSYERANGAYVLKDYQEAERLALVATDEALRAVPAKTREAVKALELAAWADEARTEYADALRRLHEAEKLTTRSRDPLEWVRVQAAIGYLLLDQGAYAQAEAILREVVIEEARVLGPTHHDTIEARNNLAVALDSQGKYREAEAEYRDIAKLGAQVLGPEHPETLTYRSNLASSLRAQGKYAEAEAEDRAILEIKEKILGPEHSDTLLTRNNLAVTLGDQGKYTEAATEYLALVKLCEKIFGPENPNTLTTRSNLANALANQERYTEAETEFRAVLNLREKILGPEHPATLTTRNSLAEAVAHQGRFVEAEAEYRVVLRLRERILGPEHPATLITRNDLASALVGEGKYVEAEVEERAVLKLREKVLGPEHPDTLRSCYDFALNLRQLAKLEEARIFARRAIDGARKLLGPDHPQTQKYVKLGNDLEDAK